MHRPTIGLITVVLLAVGFATRDQSDGALSSACLRVGLIMAILWFAQPQLKHLPRWLVAVSAVGAFVVMRWPRLVVVALPVVVILWLLRPRRPQARREVGGDRL
jgi:hypothetical protein